MEHPTTTTIREVAARDGHLGVNARHVHGFILIAHGTTDHLSKDQIRDEVRLFVAERDREGGEFDAVMESNALSYGLTA